MRLADDPLKPFQWKRRVLVVSAPNEADAQYRTQIEALSDNADGQADRELSVIRITGEAADEGLEASALRERLSMPPDRFEVVLVGMDGGVALRQRQCVALSDLFARIDTMPMRRSELRKREDQA